jgi:hypothetical protein
LDLAKSVLSKGEMRSWGVREFIGSVDMKSWRFWKGDSCCGMKPKLDEARNMGSNNDMFASGRGS